MLTRNQLTWSTPATSAKVVPDFLTISMRAVPNSLRDDLQLSTTQQHPCSSVRRDPTLEALTACAAWTTTASKWGDRPGNI